MWTVELRTALRQIPGGPGMPSLPGGPIKPGIPWAPSRPLSLRSPLSLPCLLFTLFPLRSWLPGDPIFLLIPFCPGLPFSPLWPGSPCNPWSPFSPLSPFWPGRPGIPGGPACPRSPLDPFSPESPLHPWKQMFFKRIVHRIRFRFLNIVTNSDLTSNLLFSMHYLWGKKRLVELLVRKLSKITSASLHLYMNYMSKIKHQLPSN